MGRSATYTAEQFIKAIPGTGGIISTIAKRVGCDWHTADDWLRNKPTVNRAWQDEREAVADMAESVIVKNMQEGDVQTAKWLLERLRKETYSPRQEQQQVGEQEVIFRVVHD